MSSFAAELRVVGVFLALLRVSGASLGAGVDVALPFAAGAALSSSLTAGDGLLFLLAAGAALLSFFAATAAALSSLAAALLTAFLAATGGVLDSAAGRPEATSASRLDDRRGRGRGSDAGPDVSAATSEATRLFTGRGSVAGAAELDAAGIVGGGLAGSPASRLDARTGRGAAAGVLGRSAGWESSVFAGWPDERVRRGAGAGEAVGAVGALGRLTGWLGAGSSGRPDERPRRSGGGRMGMDGAAAGVVVEAVEDAEAVLVLSLSLRVERRRPGSDVDEAFELRAMVVDGKIFLGFGVEWVRSASVRKTWLRVVVEEGAGGWRKRRSTRSVQRGARKVVKRWRETRSASGAPRVLEETRRM